MGHILRQEEFATNSGSASPNPQQLYFATLQRLMDWWLPHLKEGELKLVLFLLRNTLGRGKTSGHYNPDQLLSGIDGYCAGTGLSRATLFNAMRGLEEMGLIAKRTERGGWSFIVNTCWTPEEAMLKVPTQEKKPPKRPSLATQIRNEGSLKSGLEQSKICTYPNIDFSEDRPSLPSVENPSPAAPAQSGSGSSPETETVSAPLPETPKPLVNRAFKSLPPSSALPPSAPPKRGATGAAFEKTWREAWAEAYPETRVPAPWDIVDLAAVKKRAAKLGDEKMHALLDFAVRNWKAILQAKFAWMTESPPPSQPAIRFVLAGKLLPKFLEAFSDRETIRWLGTQRGTEAEIHRLMERGLSQEAATLEVAKGQALAADRKQREQDIASARRLYEMAAIRKNRAEREQQTRERYAKPENQPQRFVPAAPTEDRDPSAPIIAEMPDFSKWGLDQ